MALAFVSPTSAYVVWALDASAQLVQQSWLSMLQRLAAPTIQPGVVWEAATSLAGQEGGRMRSMVGTEILEMDS